MHQELFDKYLTNSLTAEEAARLGRLITQDPRARDAMVAYIRETGLIIQVAQRLEATGEARNSTRAIPVVTGSTSRLTVVAAPPRSGLRVASLAAAVVASFAALLFLALQSHRPAARPEVSTAQNAGAIPKEIPPRPPVQMVRPEGVKTPGPESTPAERPADLVIPEKRPPETPPSPSETPVPAKAESPKAPAPAPAPPAVPPKTPAATATVVAVVEQMEGDVILTGPSKPVAARAGQTILLGQGVETRGMKSRATIKYPDGSLLVLDGETALGDVGANGRRVSLQRGFLTADIAKQPAGQSFAIWSPQGLMEVLGTRFVVQAAAFESRLTVNEGRVRLTREADRAWVEVKAGYFAVAAPGVPLQVRPQDKTVDQTKIDAAIRKGIDYLKKSASPIAWEAMGNSDELILWTFIHAGVPESDPAFQKLFRPMLEGKLERTYKVAMQAMILEELDRVKYQPRIHQCAQFLVDNQARTGQWSYGEPTAFSALPAPKDVASGGRPASGGVRVFGGDDPSEKRVKPKVVRRIEVKKLRDGPGAGDNSNSQYAALGLRACHDAGIILPKEVILLAKKWWIDNQHPGSDRDLKSVATGGVSGPARGWCYCADLNHKAAGSMTAGAVGSLCIYDYILDVDWKRSSTVQQGMAWLTNHFSVTENLGHGPPCREAGADEKSFYFYYMYGLERTGMLYGTERLGSHWWYPEGAKVLIEKQSASGAWDDAYQWNKPEWNTCFAILFLRRATRPLDVASEDRSHKK